MQKRKYTKRNLQYWNERSGEPNVSVSKSTEKSEEDDFIPFSTALGSVYSSEVESPRRTVGRANHVAVTGTQESFVHISSKKMPWKYDGKKITMSETIKLIEQAYAHFAIFRNTVEILTEFSAAPIHLKGGNAISRKFVQNWFKRIKIDKLKEQLFREYYRSGNVFVYAFFGAFAEEDKRKFKSIAALPKEIPLRYVILDPKEVTLKPTSNFSIPYFEKLLTGYEVERLANPKTPEDELIFNNLPEETRKQIEQGGFSTNNGITMKLDPKRLSFMFYKKQDYEPFGIPFGYPILEDLEFKEILKVIDKTVVKTIQNVVLLITMGEKKHEYGGGMRPKAMQAMQEIFANESVTRVLVSDYTTEAKFVIPEISEILDPRKYNVVNEDIREGLLNIFTGSEKFANQMIKVKVFLERLKEGRNAICKDFLQVEVNNLCRSFGFKSIPEIYFEEIDMQDEVQMMRAYTRLVELGVLTPEQGFHAMQSGVLPEGEEIAPAQKRMVEQRKEGFFNPLVAQPIYEQYSPKFSKESKESGLKTPGQPSNVEGRPTSNGEEKYSLAKLEKSIAMLSSFLAKAEKSVKEKYNKKKLNNKEKELSLTLAKSIVSSFESDQWESQLISFLEDPTKLALATKSETSGKIDTIAAKHNLDYFSAAILYNSKYGAN